MQIFFHIFLIKNEEKSGSIVTLFTKLPDNCYKAFQQLFLSHVLGAGTIKKYITQVRIRWI